MHLAPPLFPPPPGSHWVLHQNVEVFDGQDTPDALFRPPGYAPDPTDPVDGVTWLDNFKGRTTQTYGSNFSVAGATAYELGRTIYVQIQTFVDGADDMLMAVDFGADGISNFAGSTCVNINGGEVIRYYSSPPAVWPETLQVTYQTHSHIAYDGSIAVQVMKWVGDVWAAMPDDNGLPGGAGPDNNGCPPPCENSGTGPGGSGPGGTATQEALNTSLEVTWPRTNSRVDVLGLRLGTVAQLTYDLEWDGAKMFLLDGYDLEIQANPDGGYTTKGVYHFTKFPLTDGAGNPLFFTVNVHSVNDPDHPVWGS